MDHFTSSDCCSMSLIPSYDAITADKNQFSTKFYTEVRKQEEKARNMFIGIIVIL